MLRPESVKPLVCLIGALCNEIIIWCNPNGEDVTSGRKTDGSGHECSRYATPLAPFLRPSALITSMFVPVLRILTLMSFSERSDRRERREEDEMRR